MTEEDLIDIKFTLYDGVGFGWLNYVVGPLMVRSLASQRTLTSKIRMRRLNVVLVRSSLSLSLFKFLLLLSSGSIISLSLTFSLLFPNKSRGLILVSHVSRACF